MRADIDALPIKEKTGLPYASDNGAMHACGHDFHQTSLLGAAQLLKEREAELKGTVRLIFQPAEEISKGPIRSLKRVVLMVCQLSSVITIISLETWSDWSSFGGHHGWCGAV